MENNKGSKFLVKFLAFIIVILLIILSGGIGWYLGKEGKLFNNNNTVEESKTSKKIDESKDWVYNAEYIKENKKVYTDSAKTEKYAVNSNDDLIVPYININSEYAQTVNENIKTIYDNCYSKYGSEKITSYSDTHKSYYHYILNYETHLNNNILSVIVKLVNTEVVVDGGTGGGVTTVYTYNFNLDTLNEASLNEMAVKCGFTSGQEVVSKITKWEGEQAQYLKEDNLADIFDGVQDDKYFIDENGKLNFIYITKTSGTYVHFQPVEKDKEIEFFHVENKKTNDFNFSDYIGKWEVSSQNSNSDCLTIKSINNNEIIFDYSQYRTVNYENLKANLNTETKIAEFNTNDTDMGDFWKGVYGKIKLEDNKVTLEITKSECEYIHTNTYVFDVKK